MPTAPRLWPLIVAALVFVGWIIWLAVLAFSNRHPIILSRPQILVSDTIVTAYIARIDEPVVVKDVLKGDPDLKGRELAIANLTGAVDGGLSWPGPANYLLPLQHVGADEYNVAPTAASPGYPPQDARGQRHKQGPPRIYLDTPETRAQLTQK